MIVVDTFLTALYVMVDNFCQSLTQKERRRPGPDASLSPRCLLSGSHAHNSLMRP